MRVFDSGIAAAGDADAVFLLLNMSAMDGFSFGLVTSAGGDGENWETSPSFFLEPMFFHSFIDEQLVVSFNQHGNCALHEGEQFLET